MSLTITLLVLISGLGFAIAQSVILIYVTPIQLPAQAIVDNPSTATITSTQSPTLTSTLVPTTAHPTVTSNALTASQTPLTLFPITSTQIPSLTPRADYWHSLIGYSVEGRPIEVHRFGTGQRQRMIVAGIHGGAEWNTSALANELIVHLQKNLSVVPDDVSLFILPILNPDGEARDHSPEGRVNAHGVDLNRNWDANWREAWPRDGCWSRGDSYGGPYPGSEPETQALMNFLLNHQIDVLISYHSAALGILPSGDPPHPDSVQLAKAISAVSPYPYPPVDTGCQYTGMLVDWALKQGIIGVDLELSTHYETEFDTNLQVLSVLMSWQP